MSSARRAPGRPVEFDRTEALDALVDLFWQRGYEGATQDAMLASTGLSSSSLYRTFGTKAQTFEAVLHRYLELGDDMLGPLERGTAGVADLNAMLDRAAASLRSAGGGRGCMVVATTQDPVNRDPQVSAITSRHLARIRAAVLAAATRAVNAGETLPTPLEQFVDVFYGATLGVLISARAGDRDTSMAMVAGLRALLPGSQRQADQLARRRASRSVNSRTRSGSSRA
jgi:AcrR family transcriptional regulator